MISLGRDNRIESRRPGLPFDLIITRILELPTGRASEWVLHEETLVVRDTSELVPIANHLVKVFGGDGFSIRRSEKDVVD
jgi:hypothetical protein